MKPLNLNAVAILQAMPGSQAQICIATGLSQPTVCRWCEELVAQGFAHVSKLYIPEHGGKRRPIYSKGKRPEGHRLKYPHVERNSAKRQHIWRDKMKKNGTYEDYLEGRRKRRELARKPKIHPLQAALFGATK